MCSIQLLSENESEADFFQQKIIIIIINDVMLYIKSMGRKMRLRYHECDSDRNFVYTIRKYEKKMDEEKNGR